MEENGGSKTTLVLAYAGRVIPPEFCANWTEPRKYDFGLDFEGHQGTLSILTAHEHVVAVFSADVAAPVSSGETMALALNTIQNILDWAMAAQTMLTKFSIGLTQGEWFSFQNGVPAIVDVETPKLPVPTPTEPTPWEAVKLAHDMTQAPFLQYAIRDFADGMKLRQTVLQNARSTAERGRQKDVLFYVWRAAEWVARGFTEAGRRNADIQEAEEVLGLPAYWIDDIGEVAHPLVRHGEKSEPVPEDVLEAAIDRVRDFILRYAKHMRQEQLPATPQKDALSDWLTHHPPARLLKAKPTAAVEGSDA